MGDHLTKYKQVGILCHVFKIAVYICRRVQYTSKYVSSTDGLHEPCMCRIYFAPNACLSLIYIVSMWPRLLVRPQLILVVYMSPRQLARPAATGGQ